MPRLADGSPLFRLIGDRFVYDASSGRTLVVGGALYRALGVVAGEADSNDLPTGAAGLDPDGLMVILRELGLFTAPSLRGYVLPTEEMLQTVRPNKITLVVTDSCTLRCTYCPYAGSSVARIRKQGEPFMSSVVLRKSLDFMCSSADPDCSVAFYGGEPLLAFDLIASYVNQMRSARPDWKGMYALTTNLTIYSSTIARFLADNEFLLVLSIDGDKAHHDRFRVTCRGEGSYEKVMSNFVRLADDYSALVRRARLNTVLGPGACFDSLEARFREDFRLLDRCRVSLASPLNHSFYPAYGTSYSEQLQQLLRWLRKRLASCESLMDIEQSPFLLGLVRQYLQQFVSPVANDGTGLRPFKACVPGRKAQILPDGRISICERCDDLIVGDVFTGLDHSRIARIVAEWQDCLGEDCLSCWASGFCSACYPVGWDGRRFSRQQLTEYCSRFRSTRAEWFEVYLYLRVLFGDALDQLLEPSSAGEGQART